MDVERVRDAWPPRSDHTRTLPIICDTGEGSGLISLHFFFQFLMMDPLSALSIAACIAQFIDFGSKLFRQTKEISEAGSAVSAEHVATLTRDLSLINSSLQQPHIMGLSLSKEEQVRIMNPASQS